MPSGFKVTDTTVGFSSADFDDLFVKTDFINEGGLWNWGSAGNITNGCGALGDNSIINKSSPVQTISGGGDWRIIAMGRAWGSAIKNDGTLWTWGGNQNGQLGINDTTARSSPIQTAAAATNWVDVSMSSSVISLKRDGTLWTWGTNFSGELGDGTTANKSSPVQTVAGGTNWIKICAGKGAVNTVAATKTDGTLWLWGCGANGALGNDATTNRSSPVQTISGGGNWQHVSVGSLLVSAIKTDGTLWTWGLNDTGGLGDNSTTDKSSPIQTVSGGTNWKTSSSGERVTAAIKTDGTLWLWGSNTGGRLGDDTAITRSSPVQTISGGGNWKRVSAFYEVAAIKTDGTLWLWGCGTSGVLGNNATTNRSSPVQTVASGTFWTSIDIAQDAVSALRYDCW